MVVIVNDCFDEVGDRLEQKGWTPCYSESSLLSESSSVQNGTSDL